MEKDLKGANERSIVGDFTWKGEQLGGRHNYAN